MKRLLGILILLGGLALGAAALGQYAPPPAVPPEEITLKQIATRTDELGKTVEKMRAAGVSSG